MFVCLSRKVDTLLKLVIGRKKKVQQHLTKYEESSKIYRSKRSTDTGYYCSFNEEINFVQKKKTFIQKYVN